MKKQILKMPQKNNKNKVPVVIDDRTTILVHPDKVKGARERYLKKMKDSEPFNPFKKDKL